MQTYGQRKCKTDFEKFVIVSNFDRRQWLKVKLPAGEAFVGTRPAQPAQLLLNTQGDDDDWDFYWASVTTVKQIFSPENTVRLEPHQVINHFPNHYELTRKVRSNTGI